MLWVELLWNSHHFPVSFFSFVVFYFTCGLGRFSWVVSPWLCPLFCGLGTFPLLWIHRSKVSLLLFKLFLDLDGISVCRVERGDVQELHLILDVIVWESAVLENQMVLRILDTQLHAKGMKNIGKLRYILVPSLS